MKILKQHMVQMALFLLIPRLEQVAATSEIDAEELVLNVCIDGENIEKTFYVKP